MPLCPDCKHAADTMTHDRPTSAWVRWLTDLFGRASTPPAEPCSRCGQVCDECETTF